MSISKHWLVGAIAALSVGAVFAADPAKVALVQKGELKEAKASWWGFDPQDSTKFLQAAINSKVPKLIIDKQASPWIAAEPLRGVSDQTIVFEDGAEIQAKRGAFKGRTNCLLLIDDVVNSAVIGSGGGGILRMHKKDYQDPNQYTDSQHRHTLRYGRAKNIRIENMKFLTSGGDGIYLTHVENVRIRNVLCDGNHRQGMSLICGRNILVEDSEFIRTSGHSPQCGLDIEPNYPDEPLQNIVFRNCRFAENVRCGILVVPARFDSRRAGDISIRFENCVAENNQADEIRFFGNSFYKTEDPVRGRIEFIDCKVINDRTYDYLRPAAEFSMDVGHEFDIVLKNLTVRRGNKEKALRFVFHNPRKADAKPLSKIELDRVKLLDCPPQDALRIIDYSFSGSTDNFRGVLVDGNGAEVPLDAKLLKRSVAAAAPEFDVDCSDRAVTVAGPADGTMEKYPEFPLYQEAAYWILPKAGQEVAFTLKFTKRNQAKVSGVTLIAPDGSVKVLGTLKPDETGTFRFTAGAAGIYKVLLKSLDLRVALVEANAPMGIMLRPYSHDLGGNLGSLYFTIPAGTPRFAVRVWGDALLFFHYGLKVVISDPQDRIVFRDDAVSDGIHYDGTARPGVWKITFAAPTGLASRCGNLRMMGVSPYIGLRPDRTPTLGDNGSLK